jgi:Flp pilus assembly protein TadB
MYGHWFLTTFFWIGVVLIVIAAAFLASPLIALVIAALAGGVALLAAGLKRSGENPTEASGTPRTRARAHHHRHGGAPVSGEGGS